MKTEGILPMLIGKNRARDPYGRWIFLPIDGKNTFTTTKKELIAL